MNISFSLILAQLINVALLYAIFYFAIGRRLSKIVAERRALMKKLATIDKEYAAKMQEAENAKQEFLKKAHLEAQDHMKDAEHIAKLKAEDIIKNAHAQAIQILEGGRREIEKERKTMYGQLQDRILDISISLNKKIFGTAQVDEKYIKEELKKI